jgi:hypothetical protein
MVLFSVINWPCFRLTKTHVYDNLKQGHLAEK